MERVLRQGLRLMNISRRCNNQQALSFLGARSLHTSLCVRAAEEAERPSAPLKYSTSEARAWSNRQEQEKQKLKPPKYELEIICLSIVVILVYFCVLREENDVDIALGRGLFETEPKLELPMLRSAREDFKMRGKDTAAYDKRIAELEAEQDAAILKAEEEAKKD